MVDFYADWCTSCKEMERRPSLDPAVRRALAGTRLLLRADVTANGANDQALLQALRHLRSADDRVLRTRRP